MFLDILEFQVENQKKVLWKNVLKYGFRFVEKWPVDPQN